MISPRTPSPPPHAIPPVHQPVHPSCHCGLFRTPKRASKSFRKGKNLICILSHYHVAYTYKIVKNFWKYKNISQNIHIYSNNNCPLILHLNTSMLYTRIFQVIDRYYTAFNDRRHMILLTLYYYYYVIMFDIVFL